MKTSPEQKNIFPGCLYSFKKYRRVLDSISPLKLHGTVAKVVGLVIESRGPSVPVGEICSLVRQNDPKPIEIEVVGFKDSNMLFMPYQELRGIKPGDRVYPTGKTAHIGVGKGLLGRVIDGMGMPLDEKGGIKFETTYQLHNQPPSSFQRGPITEIITTGVKVIDGMLTCGKGQRMGIFSGSGVGKSKLLGMIARNTNADINVIALIGERGREVGDFINNDLGVEGLKRSVIVVSTSDQPALLRIRATFAAMAIAEYFKDQGKNVMFMMDSLTRFATAQREIGLAVGEPTTSKGYTPSVFSVLPRLLERVGNFKIGGSITGFFTVLVENDDGNDTISDALRSILDGHILLSRQLAFKNHFPAVDVLRSISRLMVDIAPCQVMKNAQKIRAIISAFKEVEDLLQVGAYKTGASKSTDYAIKMMKPIKEFLKQSLKDKFELEKTIKLQNQVFQEISEQ